MSKENDFLKNFAMMVPLEPYNVPEKVEDPNGAPIYAGCEGAKSEWGCACTGACKKIIGYSQDPEKIAAYREQIHHHNENRNKIIDYGKLNQNKGGSFKWEFKNKDDE
jgi:hypothetical protein